MREIAIQSHRGPYTVRFGAAFGELRNGLKPNQHLLIDSKVAQLYGEELGSALRGHSVLRIDATEANKSLDRLPEFVTHLIEKGVKRNHVLVAIGGGIIQDVTAFIAATLLRGMSWEFYPTTLLAQADSCIGSKSSINVGPYKNQIGTFTPPQNVVISTDVLDTLAESDMRSGIGEMIKVHIISGWDDFDSIASNYQSLLTDRKVLEHFIYRSLEIKKKKIEADEFDRGERLIMNYGHTFGHAIESATDYAVPHGIAVTLGMDLANFISLRLEMISADLFSKLHPILARNYAGFEQTAVAHDRFFAALLKDKKNRDGAVSAILMQHPGDLRIESRPLDENFRSICRDYFAALPMQQF